MDSLLASYGSSDEEDEEKESTASAPPESIAFSLPLPPPKPSSLSLPPPKPSSSNSFSLPPLRLFYSLPPPKSHNPSPDPRIPSALKTHHPHGGEADEEAKARKPTKNFPSSTPLKPPSFSSLSAPQTTSSTSSSLFSSLPPPKSTNSSSLDPNTKRVVQFTPPFDPSVLKSRDLDEDDEDDAKERKPSKDSSSSSTSKALSSMLPAPKNSLCLAPAQSSAASRRSVVQADVPTANPEGPRLEQETSSYENYGSYDGSWASGPAEAGVDGPLNSSFVGGGEASGWVQSYGTGEDYGHYAGNDGSVTMTVPEVPDMGRILGKRGRNGIPTEIMEVKQDELIKNRPREDQAKLTGIAFGPSYQPVSSGKGAKPTKLHKRKHQIGSLYFDMKQKEMELAERRSRGFLTKAETQAKYGW